MNQFFQNYYAILDESELLINSDFPFSRGAEIIVANQVHFPNSPWFPDIYSTLNFLKCNGYKNISELIDVLEINSDTPIQQRKFKKNETTFVLISYKELEQRLCDENKKELFSKYSFQ